MSWFQRIAGTTLTILAVGVGALWMISNIDAVDRSDFEGFNYAIERGDGNWLFATASNGRLILRFSIRVYDGPAANRPKLPDIEWSKPGVKYARMLSTPSEFTFSPSGSSVVEESVFGLPYARGQAVWNVVDQTRHTIDVSFALLLVLLLPYPILLFWRGPVRKYYRRKRGWCLRCGYALVGNTSGQCPECGLVCPSIIAE